MLFNCFHCGKSISSKKELCVYCRTDVAAFASQLNKEREKQTLTEAHAGTFFSFLFKTKTAIKHERKILA